MRLEGLDDLKERARFTRIETTLGDLICAIADAASEAKVSERDLSRLTHLVLLNVLSRSQH
jgi:hypothetical protein